MFNLGRSFCGYALNMKYRGRYFGNLDHNPTPVVKAAGQGPSSERDMPQNKSRLYQDGLGFSFGLWLVTRELFFLRYRYL